MYLTGGLLTWPALFKSEWRSIRHEDLFPLPSSSHRFTMFNDPTILQRRRLEESASAVQLPFNSVSVFHRIKFYNEELHRHETLDLIHANPPSNQNVPGRFDTALIQVRGVAVQSKQLQGKFYIYIAVRKSDVDIIIDFCVGRVKVIFSIPPKAIGLLFWRERQPPKHLVYVEWFTKFSAEPEPTTKMYRIRKAVRDGEPLASVVLVQVIGRSVHLLPKWGRNVPTEWTSSNVVDLCPVFFLNLFKDMSTYFNVR
ncbi:hypothetical protein JVT61DRAFT_7876 [Boletus reticuloceps]|uniref:DUF6830 domain-containing protein n=1 Tax=Boletus reticuloceps TaxID=495285 RepID=A0A8I2YJG2_9AGAM|nr:hypothetical protein JVT61DRAFT_7876 [Boletus reticuloceps]